MSLNITVDYDEMESLIRECDAIIAQHQEAYREGEPIVAPADLQNLLNEIDTIYENVSHRLEDLNDTQILDITIEEEVVEHEVDMNILSTLPSTSSNVPESTSNETANNYTEDDIIFVGRQEMSTVPVIDLCSPARPARKRRTLNQNEVIAIDDSFESSNKTPRKDEKKAETKETKEDDEKEKDRIFIKCPICLDSATRHNPTITTCGHIFCNVCITLALKTSRTCPICKGKKPKLIKMHGLD